MADRKKVMSGLEGLAQDDWRQYHSDSEVQQIARDALALLKDKKSVKPLAIKQEMFNEYYGAVACCPKCDCMWIMYMDNDTHYCPECGQAVKWEC